MFKTKVFIKRFLIIAILLNLPPVITPIFINIGLEPIVLLVALGLWANVPLFAGLDGLFGNSNIVYGEFGMMDAPAIVMLSIVIFWIICAAFIARVSVAFSDRTNSV
ncbi:hypothetical protein [Arsukibacterium sp.]|uniref:hypothetical protein n=1 Tax=Arsukibacterium sp. TaxID=1977258 RepID=UPI001BD34D28|nr:hypothetical protein [Arsukibacterium sp.]